MRCKLPGISISCSRFTLWLTQITSISVTANDDQLAMIHLDGGNDLVFCLVNTNGEDRVGELVGTINNLWQKWVILSSIVSIIYCIYIHIRICICISHGNVWSVGSLTYSQHMPNMAHGAVVLANYDCRDHLTNHLYKDYKYWLWRIYKSSNNRSEMYQIFTTIADNIDDIDYAVCAYRTGVILTPVDGSDILQ